VAKAISNYVEIAHELAELDFGNWEMRSWDEIGPDNLDEWIASGYAAIHEGESLTNFDERTQNWLRNIEALAQPTVVAVTHAGTMRSLLRHALAIELDASLQFKVEFLQPLHLQMVDGAWQLLESEL
jgi:alpha-ribazole phosphatase